MAFERLKNESERAWAYYEKYQDMLPPRVLTALLTIEINGKTSPIRTLRRWKSNFQWDQRCREFDADVLKRVGERKIEERVEILHEILESEIEIIKIVRDKFIKGISNLDDGDLDVYKFNTLVRTWDVARVWLQESIAIADWIQEEQEDA